MAESFKYGNGVWATKTGSSMAYNDQNDNYKPVPFSVTRDSIATRVNKQGLIEVVGKDKLRIDYTDSSRGVALLEPSRTNSITYSEDFSQSIWNDEGGKQVINSNVEISPSGTLTADKLTVSSGTITTRKLWYSQSTTVGLQYTFSVYIKAVSNQVNTGFISIANLDTHINQTFFTATDVWQRVVVTATSDSATNIRFLITGDPNCQIYIWGAQLEQGSYATSYISTSGSTVTRAADEANGAGNSEVFNDSEGVLFADIAALANDGINRRLSINDNVSNDDRVLIGYSSTDNQIQGQSRTGTSTQAALEHTVSDATAFHKVAMKYKANDFALWIDGFEVDTDINGTAPAGLTVSSFDRGGGVQDFYGKTKRIGYFDAVLTDAELEALTSYTSFTNMANELNLTIK